MGQYLSRDREKPTANGIYHLGRPIIIDTRNHKRPTITNECAKGGEGANATVIRP